MPGPLPIDDAIAVAGMLVATGRAVPIGQWVDAFVHRANEAGLNGLF